MILKQVIVFVLISIHIQSLSGQCPRGDSVIAALELVKSDDTAQLHKWLLLEQELRQCNFKDTGVLAKVTRRIGNFYFYKSMYPESVLYGKKSIHLLQQLSSKSKPALADLSDAYRLISYCYHKMDEQVLRMEAIDSVFSIDRQADSTYKGTCMVGRYKVQWLFVKGDYRHCLNTGDLVLDRIRNHLRGEDSMGLILSIVTYQVQAYMFLDEMDKAWALVNQYAHEFKKYSGGSFRGVLYNLITGLYQHENNGVLAAANIRSAFRSHLGKYNKGCAESMFALSDLYLELFKKPDSALNFAQAGLKYADASDSLSLLTLMAKCYIEKKRTGDALRLIQQAFNFIGPGFDENSLIGKPVDEYITSQLSQVVVSLVTTKGDVFRKRYEITKDKSDLMRAIKIYKCVNHLLIDIKSSHLESDSKLSWQKTVHSLYENAIEACYILARPDAAFYFFENSRAFLLSEGLKFSRMMFDREKELLAVYRLELLRQRNLLSQLAPGDLKYEETKDAINKIVIAQEELRIKLISRRGMFNTDPFSDEFEGPIHLKNSILKNHDALIEIFEGDSAVYVWSFDKQIMKITKASKGAYDSLVKIYIAGLSRQPTLRSGVMEWEKASLNLYNLMFKEHNLPMGRIVFSPDRNIIPFECLITGYKDNRPQYLIHRAALSYTYSATYLQDVLKGDASDARARFSGFAPVRFSSMLKLTALSGSDRSLEKIEDGFRESTVHVGRTATKASFIEGLSRSNIMHLYTHAAVNIKTGEPEIYFHDSVLTLNEMVLALEPTVRIINLAACETALGKSYYGEGVFSFSRVLASYGIPTSVANVWSVPDKATYRLNESFYEFLSAGMTADVALQHAKLVFLREAPAEMSPPYYWAASILTGESDISFPPRKWLYSFAALGLCLAMIAITWGIMRGITLFKTSKQPGI